MREADDQAVKRARIFVDTRAGAAKEAGDIVVPLKKKIIDAKAIKGDLFDLLPRQGEGPHLGRADHAVQVGRHRDRGPGGGHAGVEDAVGLRADKHGAAR